MLFIKSILQLHFIKISTVDSGFSVRSKKDAAEEKSGTTQHVGRFYTPSYRSNSPLKKICWFRKWWSFTAFRTPATCSQDSHCSYVVIRFFKIIIKFQRPQNMFEQFPKASIQDAEANPTRTSELTKHRWRPVVLGWPFTLIKHFTNCWLVRRLKWQVIQLALP
jgi:hypothetical protein